MNSFSFDVVMLDLNGRFLKSNLKRFNMNILVTFSFELMIFISDESM